MLLLVSRGFLKVRLLSKVTENWGFAQLCCEDPNFTLSFR
jgi:hypothetical protein